MQRDLGLMRRGARALTIIGAGLLISSVAASSPALGIQVTPSNAVVHTVPPASGNVLVSVPVASFGPADGAPSALAAGRSYPIVITVWVAATSGPAVVNVVTSSGRLTGGTHATVRAGVTRLHYELVLAPGATDLTIAVHARTHDGGSVTAAYNHSTR
jgi:hypothetical protein